MGEPRTAQRRRSPSEPSSAATAAGVRLAPGLELCHVLLMSLGRISELGLTGIEIDRDEIEPFALLRVGRRLQCGLAGGRDRPRGQALVAVGVVLRLARSV